MIQTNETDPTNEPTQLTPIANLVKRVYNSYPSGTPELLTLKDIPLWRRPISPWCSPSLPLEIMSSLDKTIPLEELEQYFRDQAEVALAYLYGSYARGTSNLHSDIDVAVLLEGSPDEHQCFDARLEIIGDLMNILDSNQIDVAVLNQAPPALRYGVIRDGELLFCRDEDKRIQFQMRSLNEYLDFKPILDRHKKAIFEKARKGELLSGHNPHRGALERYRRLRERLKGIAKSDL